METESEFLKEFICCYEMQRCLWDITSPEYMIRDVKMKAYEELLKIMKKYKPKCSYDDVKKKINTIRSSYRRELKKIKQSQSSGAGIDNIYQPKIWWFDACKFLQRYEKPTESITTMSEEDALHDTSSCNEANNNSIYEPPYKGKKNNKHKDVMDMAISYLQKESDNFEHLALAWSAKLRNMQSTQSKLAERLISEILFQGDMEMLTLDTTIERRTPTSNVTNSSYSRSSTPHANSADRPFRSISQSSTTSYTNTYSDPSILNVASNCYSRSSTPHENSADRQFRSISQLSTNSHTNSAPSAPQHELSPIPTEKFLVSSQDEQIEEANQYESNVYTNIKDFIYTFKE